MKCDGCGKDLKKPYAVAPSLAWCKPCWIKEGQGVVDQIKNRKPGEPAIDPGYNIRHVRIIGGEE